MSLRVVVYAEGSGEGARGVLPAPGDPLKEGALGAAHILVRRCLNADARIPEAAIRFDSPLRTRGHMPRGSDFLHALTLAQLLTWLRPDMQPDLAVVIVDADGDSRRKPMLDEAVNKVRVNRVVAVAVQEFEAWLIADEAAVAAVLGQRLSRSKAPEQMARREAKELLKDWLAMSVQSGAAAWELRRRIADRADLAVIAERCPAFAAFRKELTLAVQSRQP
jgi:hypothetical protein